MNIIFTVLVAFPIGYLVKPRGLAVVAYLAVDALLFAYQTLNVLLAWLGPTQGTEGEAFGSKPTGFPVESSSGELWAYGLVNLVIISAGAGLVVLGAYVARRRAASDRSVAVV